MLGAHNTIKGYPRLVTGESYVFAVPAFVDACMIEPNPRELVRGPRDRTPVKGLAIVFRNNMRPQPMLLGLIFSVIPAIHPGRTPTQHEGIHIGGLPPIQPGAEPPALPARENQPSS